MTRGTWPMFVRGASRSPFQAWVSEPGGAVLAWRRLRFGEKNVSIRATLPAPLPCTCTRPACQMLTATLRPSQRTLT